MRRALGLLLAAVLGVGVLAAIAVSVRSRVVDTPGSQLIVVRGVIGSEKQPYFSDPEVIRVFHNHGLDVKVDTAGSRQIASLDLSHYDFAFPAGVPAAEKIRREKRINTSYSPFYTPMVVASFKSIANLLVSNNVAKDQGGYYTLDVQAYLSLVARNARWSDLPNSSAAYPSTRSILITSTDVRKSNSAAMYLAIASYVANGNNIVQDPGQVAAVLPKVEPLFLRQGYTESSSEAPFEDYLSIGIGKTPLVMIYEAQFVARAAANDGSITKDMVLMYPTPTVFSKHTLVPLTPAGDRAGRLLMTDPDLQRLAIKYGFRTTDVAAFNKFVTSHQVVLPPTLYSVVEPPTYETLESMISVIEQQLQGVTP